MKKTFLIVVSVLLFSQGNANAAIAYNLAAGWSDASNPNGVWSYNSAPGEPIISHVGDWDPNTSDAFGSAQPAWARAAYSAIDHVPVWFKRVSDSTTLDVPLGYVGMHGSKAFVTQEWVGVSWTSPGTGVVDILGGAWLAFKTGHPGRNENWQIRLNNTLLTGGSLLPSDAYSSSSPFLFSTGTGGASAVHDIAVHSGDFITLEFRNSTQFSTFVGMDYSISYSSVPIPGAAWLLGSGLIGLVVIRRRRNTRED